VKSRVTKASAPGMSTHSLREEDASFRALVKRSRLRPDLIAARLEKRSASDVCAYRDELEAAARARGRERDQSPAARTPRAGGSRARAAAMPRGRPPTNGVVHADERHLGA
jgi:hypothetical protein